MTVNNILLVLALLTCRVSLAQHKHADEKGTSPEAYIATYATIAKAEMRRSGIPASITLAQGILESQFGNSSLAKKANNHFGIKCHTGWQGKKYFLDDDEKDECFRVYKSAEESFFDHSDFLMYRERYAALFDLDATDYKGWAKGLQKAGYATNPNYGSLLIRIIEDRRLHKYDIAHSNTSLDKKIQAVTERILIFNGVKMVIADVNDTPNDISNKFGISVKRVLKYNDMSPGQEIPRFTKVYLQPKRSKGYSRIHEVKEDETMHLISQKEGIKLNALYKKNLMVIGEEPATGEKLTLRRKNHKRPKVKSENELRELIEKGIEDQLNEVKTEHKKDSEEKPVYKPKERFVNGQWRKVDEGEAPPKNTTLPESEKEKPVDKQKDNKKTPELKDSPPPTNKEPIYHTIMPKEGLYGISKKYNITIEQVKTWNNLSSNTISLGQKLIVGYKNKSTPPKNTDKLANTKSPIYHYVQPKESLYGIATLFGIKVEQIIAWNKLNSNTLSVGQKLIVGYETANKSVKPSPKSGEAHPYYHIVKAKEGLFGIAELYKTSVEHIKSWNGLSSTTLFIGQKLIVGYGSEKPESIPSGPKPIFHTIQPREGLYSIARQYNVTIEQLREWNHLENDNLWLGQKLVVGYK